MAQVDAPRRHGKIGVGHDDTQQQQRVGVLDSLAHRGVAGQAEIGADERHVGMRHQPAAHEARDHRNGQPSREFGHPRFHAVAAHLDADHQHRPLRGGQARQQFVGTGGQALGIGDEGGDIAGTASQGLSGMSRGISRYTGRDRASAASSTRAMSAGARCAVVQTRTIDGEFLEQPPLRIQRLHLVVQQQAAGGFMRRGCTRQHHQRHPSRHRRRPPRSPG